jgi:hypothetical protein
VSDAAVLNPFCWAMAPERSAALGVHNQNLRETLALPTKYKKELLYLEKPLGKMPIPQMIVQNKVYF